MLILGNIPKKTYLAYSGGSDSASALAFLLQGRREVSLCYFHHGTEHGEEAFYFTASLAAKLGLEFVFSTIYKEGCALKEGLSKEAQWRDARYSFFSKLDGPICMAHHLDDQVENWIFTSAHGQPRLIPYQNKSVYRPFLCMRKESFLRFAKNQKIEWIEDPSNTDLSYKRNYIRHVVKPAYMGINPGIYKTLIKKIRAEHQPKES